MEQATLLKLLSPYNIIVYMLVFTRLSGLFQSAPFFSSLNAPMMTKIWFSAIMAFLIYPLVMASKNFILPHSMPEFIILLLLEFLIGFLLGFIANLIIEGVRMSGSIISIQTGLSMSEALDPITGINSNEISRLYVYLATLIFLATGAYQTLFATIFQSFSTFPIGTFPILENNFMISVVQLFSGIFKIALGVAFPIFAVLLTSDILLGMMSKMMPQMNIYMVALPVKIYIGLILFIAFLSATNIYLTGTIKQYLNAIWHLIT